METNDESSASVQSMGNENRRRIKSQVGDVNLVFHCASVLPRSGHLPKTVKYICTNLPSHGAVTTSRVVLTCRELRVIITMTYVLRRHVTKCERCVTDCRTSTGTLSFLFLFMLISTRGPRIVIRYFATRVKS